jgi:predicted esterase
MRAVLFALMLAGCGDDDGSTLDGGRDAGSTRVDGGGDDAGADAGMPDAGYPRIDAGGCRIEDDVPEGCEEAACRQLERRRDDDCTPQGYLEYTPPGYGDGTARPLLLFFHGIGENGDGDGDLSRVAAHGPPRLVRENDWPLERDMIVLSPQHPGGGCHTPAEIHSFIERAIALYDVDVSRIYLTGLSCGAIGLWDYFREHLGDQPIAAFVPIAGNGRATWDEHMCDLAQVPVWAFHGDDDGTVTPDGTTYPLENLLMCEPAPDAQMVIYPGVGHDSWTQTYDGSAGHDVFGWLLEHRFE